MICHIEKRVTLFLSTQRELLIGFENRDISDFISHVEEGKTLSSAFDSVKGRLALSEESKSMLGDFFSDFGKSYRTQELLRIEMFVKEFFEKQ